MYSGCDGVREGRVTGGQVALIYSHVLAIVSPGFDYPYCLENYRARRGICKRKCARYDSEALPACSAGCELLATVVKLYAR